MKIPYFFLWVLYYLLTMDDRIGYDLSLEKNARYKGSRDTGWFPGSEKTYYFDPNEKPYRDFLTWSEFWQQRGY